ncbi:hypothetical protein FRB98_003951, partial [Tulasnella sp. 332]
MPPEFAGPSRSSTTAKRLKVLPEGFMYDTSDSIHDVKCTTCAAGMTRKAVSRHLKSTEHARNVRLAEEMHRQTLADAHTAAGPAILSTLLPWALPTPLSTHPQHATQHFPDSRRVFHEIENVDDSVMFSVGENELLSPAEDARRMEESLQHFGLWEQFLDVDEAADDEDPYLGFDEELAEELHGVGDLSEADIQARLSGISPNQDWFPYGNKTMFLLDLLSNLPRLRLSDSHFRMILWVMKESGCRDVPALSALKALKKNLRERVGARTRQYKSDLGNVFYMNDVGYVLTQDILNPLVAPSIHWYPEEPDGPISEAWHADRWRKEVPNELLSPMYTQNGKHFYVNELACDVSQRMYIPLKWITRKGMLTADAYQVVKTDAGYRVIAGETVQIVASSLRFNLLDIISHSHKPLVFSTESHPFRDQMPNPLRELAGGDEIYCSFLKIWGDDVSGARSKQYNLHNNFYAAHVNLPTELLQHEFFVRFCSTSPNASIIEQFCALSHQV